MGRRIFNREFKLEAIRLVRERGISVPQAGRDLGIHANVVSRWVRDAVGTAFVITLAGERLYGGLFYPEVGAAAIRFPVIHALGEPIAFLRIRPALGHGWAADEPSLTAQRAAIANPVLAAWLTQKELIRSIPTAKRPRDPWARQA